MGVKYLGVADNADNRSGLIIPLLLSYLVCTVFDILFLFDLLNYCVLFSFMILQRSGFYFYRQNYNLILFSLIISFLIK